jgi:tetratricopeptide (TPR) repeat protein
MRLFLSVISLWVVLPLHGQSVDALLAHGDSLHDALQPAAALARYKKVLTLVPDHYETLWRAARDQIDVARLIGGDQEYTVRVRDSVYAEAVTYAERAIAADSAGADGWFVLATAMGQRARTKGGRERVRSGREIYQAAARALAREPDHDGAHHVLGAWHAEVRRLSGFTRFFARTFLGGGYLDRASWDSAVTHLEIAVRGRPDYLFHRLELAEIYVEVDRPTEAIAQLEMIPTLPDRDVLDPHHRAVAAALLERLRR